MSLWPCGPMRSQGKLKAKYFFFQRTYGHQTWQGTDKLWGEGKNEVAWLSDHVTWLMATRSHPWSHMKKSQWKIQNVISMIPKLGRVATKGEGATPIKPYRYWIRCLHNKLKTRIENCSLVNKNWNISLFEDSIFSMFDPNSKNTILLIGTIYCYKEQGNLLQKKSLFILHLVYF